MIKVGLVEEGRQCGKRFYCGHRQLTMTMFYITVKIVSCTDRTWGEGQWHAWAMCNIQEWRDELELQLREVNVVGSAGTIRMYGCSGTGDGFRP